MSSQASFRKSAENLGVFEETVEGEPKYRAMYPPELIRDRLGRLRFGTVRPGFKSRAPDQFRMQNRRFRVSCEAAESQIPPAHVGDFKS